MPRAKDSETALTNAQLRALAAGRTPQQIGEVIVRMLSVGSRRKELDLDKMVKMKMAGCPIGEIAAEFGVDEKTIDRRLKQDPLYRKAFEDGDKRGKAAIRTRQYLKAVGDGDMTALIWAGKQRLGQSDHPSTDRGTDRLGELFDAVYAQATVTVAAAVEVSPLDAVG